MEGSQTRMSTRSAGASANFIELPAFKEEPVDEDFSLDPTIQPDVESAHENSSLNGRPIEDAFIHEMEIGETSIGSLTAISDLLEQKEIKSENVAAAESDANAENVEVAGSSTGKRKHSDEEESEEDASTASKSLQESTTPNNFLLNNLVTDRPMCVDPNSSNYSNTEATTQVHSTKETPRCTYIIQMLNDEQSSKARTQQIRVSADQAQQLANVPIDQIRTLRRVAAPPRSILNSRIRVKNFATIPMAPTVKPSAPIEQPVVHTKECTHCPCFEKFINEQDKKMDLFLTKQQKIVSEILNLQRHIMNKLNSIEITLETSEALKDAEVIEGLGGCTEEGAAHSPTQYNLQDTADELYEAEYLEEQQNENEIENSEEVQLFSFTRMETAEELNEFDRRLNEPEYFRETYNWLNSLITETNCSNRMLVALDLLFDKVFVNKCSWTGRGKGNNRKVPLRCRRGLLHLFKVVGSTRRASVTRADVEDFFIKKLKQSKQRLNMQGIRKATCHVKRVQTS